MAWNRLRRPLNEIAEKTKKAQCCSVLHVSVIDCKEGSFTVLVCVLPVIFWVASKTFRLPRRRCALFSESFLFQSTVTQLCQGNARVYIVLARPLPAYLTIFCSIFCLPPND